jgi:predicted nucleic acid-binding protein
MRLLPFALVHPYNSIEFIPQGSFGYYALLQIMANGQILRATKNQYTPFKKHFLPMVRDKTDIFFLAIAASSKDRCLVSDDYQDFQKSKRRIWEK